ncbi:hypothetical protein OAM69_03600 [bacterium]|nr:hypothetical protein [bacterium]
MLQLKRQTYKYSLIGVLLLSLSACGSSDSDGPLEAETTDNASEVSDQPANPFNAPDQPADTAPVEDDVQVQTESPEDSQAPVGTDNDTSSIAGLWNVTRTTAEGDDVVYVLISDNGELTEFDFQGDISGDGRECYVVRNQQIASRGANQFDIQNDSVLPGSQGSEDVMISIEDGSLVFRYFGLIEAPEGGNELSPQTSQFSAADLTLDDLTACE